MKIQFEIITPERSVLKDEIDQITVPTKEGEITILPNHIPLISVLTAGELIIKKGEEVTNLAVSSGVIEVRPGSELYIVADTAERAEQIDIARAEAARQRAEELMKQQQIADVDYARIQAKLEKELARLKSKLASAQGNDLVDQAAEINGIKVLAAQLEGADATGLRETLDKLKDKLNSAAIVLAAVADGKVSLIAGVTPDLTAKIKAGDLVNMVAQQVGGKGGGRPDMAMAGGTQPEHLAHALSGVVDWVKART